MKEERIKRENELIYSDTLSKFRVQKIMIMQSMGICSIAQIFVMVAITYSVANKFALI